MLKDGCVVEQGGHSELMRQGGHYHALVTAQLGNVERDGEMTDSKIVIEDYDEDAKDSDVIAEEVNGVTLSFHVNGNVFVVG